MQKNIEEKSEVARLLHGLCLFVSCGSPRPGTKLLALSYLQARRRSLRDSSSTDISGSFVFRFVTSLDTSVIGASLPTIGCALLSQVSRTTTPRLSFQYAVDDLNLEWFSRL